MPPVRRSLQNWYSPTRFSCITGDQYVSEACLMHWDSHNGHGSPRALVQFGTVVMGVMPV